MKVKETEVEVEVKEVSTPKAVVIEKSTSRIILGKKLSKKLPNEMIATIEVIKKNAQAKRVNVPFLTLYNEYLKEMKKISSSKSNLKTRFRRLLYRNLESVLTKNSIQSAKFNLKSNIKGITIKAKNPILFKDNQDAIISSVDENYFSFKVLKNVTTIEKRDIDKAILESIVKLKE